VQPIRSLMHWYLAFHPSLFESPFLLMQSPNSVPYTPNFSTNLSEGSIMKDRISSLSSWFRKWQW
jgi:hypothetical protein